MYIVLHVSVMLSCCGIHVTIQPPANNLCVRSVVGGVTARALIHNCSVVYTGLMSKPFMYLPIIVMPHPYPRSTVIDEHFSLELVHRAGVFACI